MVKKTAGKKDKPVSPEKIQMANARLSEFISSQNFKSIEEVNEFLKVHVLGKRIDEILPKKKGRKTNFEKSDDLISEAYDCPPDEGLKLAKRALELNPENIRALNYVAESEEDILKSIELYKESMNIGYNYFGDDFFKENKGHFWLIHETRPFMTAKQNYAECLYAVDRYDEAIKEFQEMLELNPNDNQGVRFSLSVLLLEQKMFKEYLILYKKYKDDCSAHWLFNYALFLFLSKGDVPESYKALRVADESNKLVLQYISQQKPIPEDRFPEYFSPGDEDEALLYLMESHLIWAKYPDTIFWIMRYINRKKNQV